MLRFHLVSLFPEFFRSPLETALLGRAREAGIVDFSFHDPRSFSTSRHHHVDDRPYGGGPGMVMQGEPVAAALRSIEKPGRMILLAPSGRPLNDALARELAREEDLTLICGRYEGLDARLLDIFPLEPVSVGEAVLNGGETAALAVIESVARLVPGFMGKEAVFKAAGTGCDRSPRLLDSGRSGRRTGDLRLDAARYRWQLLPCPGHWLCVAVRG